MKVLVLGASGFIGSAATYAFVRAGHIVWGQTRSTATADEFGTHEVMPVVCDPHSPEGQKVWGAVAKDVDVVIDCLAAAGPEKALAIFSTFTAAVAHRPPGSPRPTFIYCSGHYVMARGYGGLPAWTDERQPADAPCNKGTIWRELIEVPVLHSDKVNGIVVRPTCLYGKSGSYFAVYHFDPALRALQEGEHTFTSICSANGKISTIHTDDLADLFVRVAERGGVCRGQVFVASNPSTDNIRDILDGIVRVAGLSEWKARDPEDAYETAWVTPILQKPTLAHALTGWAPRKMALSDGIDVYWHAYLAAVKKRTLEIL